MTGRPGSSYGAFVAAALVGLLAALYLARVARAEPAESIETPAPPRETPSTENGQPAESTQGAASDPITPPGDLPSGETVTDA